MFDDMNVLVTEIKNRIMKIFLYANVNVVFDQDHNEYFVSVDNSELYYSEAFQSFVMGIKQDILWKENIHNFYFILDETFYGFERITREISSERKETSAYAIWDFCNGSSIAGDTLMTIVFFIWRHRLWIPANNQAFPLKMFY
jgi:hypothetical protein